MALSNMQHDADTIVCRPTPGDHLEQMKGRVDRPGQSAKRLVLVVVYAANTIEEVEFANIKLAGNFFRQYIAPVARRYKEQIDLEGILAAGGKKRLQKHTVSKAWYRSLNASSSSGAWVGDADSDGGGGGGDDDEEQDDDAKGGANDDEGAGAARKRPKGRGGEASPAPTGGPGKGKASASPSGGGGGDAPVRRADKRRRTRPPTRPSGIAATPPPWQRRSARRARARRASRCSNGSSRRPRRGSRRTSAPSLPSFPT